MSTQAKAMPEITRAAERYLEQYGDPLVMNTYLKVTILVLAVVCLALAALAFKSQRALASMHPMIVRINDVGRAEAIDYRNFNYRPQEAENKYYLSQWAELYFSRNRFTIERDQTNALYFLNSDVQRAVIDQERKDLIQACQSKLAKGNVLTFDFFRAKLLARGQFATLERFESALRGGMYSSNILITRYLLVKIDETHHSREYAPDLWARNDGDKFVWTVEHVLPQSENIPDAWVNMIADGDKKRASILHEQDVDKLGNLTLSGYNSKLAAAGFDKKQALAEKRKFLGHEINIGYKNGLALNNLSFKVGKNTTSLATAPAWTHEMIDARTDRICRLLLDMYKFEGVD